VGTVAALVADREPDLAAATLTMVTLACAIPARRTTRVAPGAILRAD
jgi:hypothetical protein